MTLNELVLFQLFYIFPSIMLYAVELYVMFIGEHKYKFNKSSFNRIFAIYAVNNIVANVLYYFFFRMSKAPTFSELFQNLSGHHISLVLLWQLLFHTSMITNLLDLILSLNRFTAAIMSVRYNAFWISKIKWVAIFILVLPCIAFWPFQFREIEMAYLNNSKAYYMIYTKPLSIPWPSSASSLGACVVISCVGCFFCNAYVGFKLWQRKTIVASSNDQQEKMYFLFTICVFLTQLLSCTTEVISIFLL